jgi:hypothetical protein
MLSAKNPVRLRQSEWRGTWRTLWALIALALIVFALCG